MEEGFDVGKFVANYIKYASEKRFPEERPAVYSDQLKLYTCSVCGAPVQARIDILGNEHIVPCMCLCDLKEREMEELEKQLRKQERRRKACFNGDRKLTESTFETDDSPETKLSKIARAYAAKFSAASPWLLISGSNGIGKSFYAACVCNAIIDDGFTARFIRISDVERMLWDAESKEALYRQLGGYDLLVIDDLGEARDTEYMKEITFTVVDDRLRSGKPCVITTNLKGTEMENTRDPQMRKIYSRICERAIPIVHTGEERRYRAMKTTYKARLEELLGGGE